jgi:hypothetical protein
VSSTRLSELEAEIIKTAAEDPTAAFLALADLAEEAGKPEAARTIRRLQVTAADLRERLALIRDLTRCGVRQLQATRAGNWSAWLDGEDARPLEGRDPDDTRGYDDYLGQAVANFDDCFPGLDALRVALGFKVVDELRATVTGVLQVRFANE